MIYDAEAAERFLHKWFTGCEGLIELRYWSPGVKDPKQEWFTRDNIPNLARRAIELSRQKQEVYFGVSTRKGRKGDKASVNMLPGLFADVDFGDNGIVVSERLKKYRVQPTAVVHSGGGFHLYFQFEAPMYADAKLQRQIKALVKDLGADRAATDTSRVLRVPGTFSYKNDLPVTLQSLEDTPLSFSVFDYLPLEDVDETSPLPISGEIPDTLPESFIQILERSERVREMWECPVPGGKYPSLNEKALAVANECHYGRLSLEDAIAVQGALYEIGAKPREEGIRKSRYTLPKAGYTEEGPQPRTQAAIEREAPRQASEVGTQPAVKQATRVQPVYETANENLRPEPRKLHFPQEAYVGLAAEVASVFSDCFETPKQFYYIDYLSFLGAMVCRHVSLKSQLHNEARIYSVKVAESERLHKSFSQVRTHKFLKPALEDRVFVSSSPASGSGLARLVERGKGLPTVLLEDELQFVIKKGQIEASVLYQALASLFHLSEYRNFTTKDTIEVEGVSLTVVSACTTETYETMFNSDFVNIGGLNRFFVVTGYLEKEVIEPEFPPEGVLEGLLDRTIQQVNIIEQQKPLLTYTSGGLGMWKEYAADLRRNPQGDATRRLEEYGRRFMQLFAVTSDKRYIDETVIGAVCALLNYEKAARIELAPVVSETKTGRLEQAIIKHSRKGKMSESHLKKLCNASRYPLKMWSDAKEICSRERYIKVTKTAWGNTIEPLEPDGEA